MAKIGYHITVDNKIFSKRMFEILGIDCDSKILENRPIELIKSFKYCGSANFVQETIEYTVCHHEGYKREEHRKI